MNKTPNVIKCEYLARVEGEGAFDVFLDDGKVTGSRFRIIEPPRFFESLLRGRKCVEAPDITSRICGICPIAYQTSACRAIEDAYGIILPPALRMLRRLIYCGEWIESHGLHVVMLHAPDFLGYDDSIKMAADYPLEVERGLKIRRIGNGLMAFLGGREVHPVNLRVGGFYRVPAREDLLHLRDGLKWARDAAAETARWVARFDFPDFEQDYEFVALRSDHEYAIAEGRMAVLAPGQPLELFEYEDYSAKFQEFQVEHSTALQSRRIDGGGPDGSYLTGPLARFNINYDRLTPFARQLAASVGLNPGCRNPFKSIIVRAVETAYAADDAIRLIDEYEPPASSLVRHAEREGVGHGASEAPRGLLYHRYRSDDQGFIREATIVPPTAQNQRRIEVDLRRFLEPRLDQPRDQLTWQCEQLIRNFDPCISCSTHFLKVRFFDKMA